MRRSTRGTHNRHKAQSRLLRDGTAAGATVGDPQLISGGRYSVSITKPTDGAVTIDVPAGVVTDAAGNANLAAAESLTITVDGTALVPQISTSEPSLTSNDSFDVSIDFGERVIGFQLSDLTVINGTASGRQDLGGGRYAATIAANGDGQVAVLMPAGAAQDSAGNLSLTSSLLSLFVDTSSPAPVLVHLAAQGDQPFGQCVRGILRLNGSNGRQYQGHGNGPQRQR